MSGRWGWSLLLAGALPALASAQAPDSVRRVRVSRTVDVDSVTVYRTRYDTLRLTDTLWRTDTVAQGSACTGIDVSPGQNLQTLSAANPAGTVFCLQAGTYSRQSVTPKDRQQFIGEPCKAAILDGDSVTTYAFKNGTAPRPDSVVIKCLTIQRYLPADQMGAIKGGGHTTGEGTRWWFVDSNEVRFNRYAGVRLGHQMRVRWNNIHHNDAQGLNGIGDSAFVYGNEIAYNNPSNIRTWPEFGAFKFVRSRGQIVRQNFSHHNRDHGMWFDVDNIDILVDSNRVEDNHGAGIFEEISYAAIIRHNTVKRNGFSRTDYVMGSGILVAASRDVEVAENVVDSNYRAINSFQQARGSGTFGAREIRNLNVHGNTVRQNACANGQSCVGVSQDIGNLAIFADWGISFEGNVYILKGSTNYFGWNNGMRSDAAWQGFGNDTPGGAFTRIP